MSNISIANVDVFDLQFVAVLFIIDYMFVMHSNKMTIVKKIAILLSLTMLAAFFVACGNKDEGGIIPDQPSRNTFSVTIIGSSTQVADGQTTNAFVAQVIDLPDGVTVSYWWRVDKTSNITINSDTTQSTTLTAHNDTYTDEVVKITVVVTPSDELMLSKIETKSLTVLGQEAPNPIPLPTPTPTFQAYIYGANNLRKGEQAILTSRIIDEQYSQDLLLVPTYKWSVYPSNALLFEDDTVANPTITVELTRHNVVISLIATLQGVNIKQANVTVFLKP